MKSTLLSVLVALTAWSSNASAQATCTGSGWLDASGVQAALAGVWHCALDLAGTKKWNESIPNASSGTFKECHSGLTTGPDPIDNNAGTYTIANDAGQGVITYTYGATSYAYRVRPGPTGFGAPYEFCNVATNERFKVWAGASCPPSGALTCP